MHAMFTLPSSKILSVTELNRSIRAVLETEFPFVTVAGEISNLRQPYSGHLYFTLKDETAQLRAVMFKLQRRYLTAALADGRQVICRGRISAYETRGEYQLIIDFMEFKGTGALQIAFEQLKKKLAAEGLFDAARKRKLPQLPARVALVTSPVGAAVFDFLRVTSCRFPAMPIEIFPVRVQGSEAPGEIVAALAELNLRKSSDVIVLCRGGGSLEDLWAFNEEQVARAIYASRIPVVAAVGHEIDFTIADFVADYRAPTPSAAAEAVIPDRLRLLEKLQGLKLELAKRLTQKINEQRHRLRLQRRMLGDPRTTLAHFLLRLDNARTILLHAFAAHLRRRHAAVEQLHQRLQKMNPRQQLAYHEQHLQELTRRLQLLMGLRLERKRHRLQNNLALLKAVSPHAVLGRGYAIVRAAPPTGVIRSSRQVKKGQVLEILLQEGRIGCEVVEITKP